MPSTATVVVSRWSNFDSAPALTAIAQENGSVIVTEFDNLNNPVSTIVLSRADLVRLLAVSAGINAVEVPA